MPATAGRASAPPEPNEWSAPRGREEELAFGRALLILIMVGIVPVGAALLVSSEAGVAAGVVYILLASLWVALQGRLALRAVGAHRLEREEAPRLFSLVEGLAGDASVRPPALRVIEGGGPNALICRARGPVVAVTRALLDSYTRTELEAVVSHCIERTLPYRLWQAALSSAVGGGAGTGVNLQHIDARAVARTRYPPALATAIEKADPVGGRGAPLWFVPTSARQKPGARVEALQDL